MKKSKFAGEQIAFALKHTGTGTKMAEVCRTVETSDATFYTWKKKIWRPWPSELQL